MLAGQTKFDGKDKVSGFLLLTGQKFVILPIIQTNGSLKPK